MPLPLIANIDTFRAAARYMHRSGSLQNSWILLVVAGGVLLLWGCFQFYEKYRKLHAHESHSPRDLFLELCGVHQLSRKQKSLLWNVAAHLEPEMLANVFADPHILGKLSLSANPQADDYARLNRKLFGERAER